MGISREDYFLKREELVDRPEERALLGEQHRVGGHETQVARGPRPSGSSGLSSEGLQEQHLSFSLNGMGHHVGFSERK